MSMKNFTPEELKPSESTLLFIKQLAHTYRVVKNNHHYISYCLN